MNIKVWIAERGYDYEGSDVIGVFTNKESAINCCKSDFSENFDDIELEFVPFENSEGYHAEYGSRFYNVIEWEVSE